MLILICANAIMLGLVNIYLFVVKLMYYKEMHQREEDKND